MAHFYVKNNTGVNQAWLGQVIAPSTYHLVEDEEANAWRHDSDFNAAVSASQAILASTDDGLTDITDPSSAFSFLADVDSTQFLTVDFGSAGVVLNTFLRIPSSGATSDATPYIMLFESTLKGVAFTNEIDDRDCDLEIYKNGALVFTWAVRGARYARKTDGMGIVTFTAGDLLSVFCRQITGNKNPKNLNLTLALSSSGFKQETSTIPIG